MQSEAVMPRKLNGRLINHAIRRLRGSNGSTTAEIAKYLQNEKKLNCDTASIKSSLKNAVERENVSLLSGKYKVNETARRRRRSSGSTSSPKRRRSRRSGSMRKSSKGSRKRSRRRSGSRRRRNSKKAAASEDGKAPRRKAAAKGHELPEPIPEGQEITDTQKKTWIINKVIGSGGFGTVYFAAEKNKPKEVNYVVKVEYHKNGPLFAEMHCYQKIAKPAMLSDWVKKKKLDYLGLSPGHGFGSFELNGSKYRFMVLERYDKDLQKLLDENGRKFPLKTVCLVGLSVIDVLEYIHSCGYVHGDVKAANLLTGYRKGTENQVYLVDMGLACKYITDGVHKKDVPDPKKAHNGTPEFTSRDAHKGSFSRRSDLEILAYNLLQWISGRLPWEDFISDNKKLQKEKERYMDNIEEFLDVMFPEDDCPSGISKFLEYVTGLTFEDEPNYSHCRKLLKDVLKSIGCANDNKLEFTTKMKKKSAKTTATPVTSAPEQVSNKENGKQVKTAKRTQTKRKVPEEIKFEEGMVLTPAMQEILNNKKLKDTKPSSRRK